MKKNHKNLTSNHQRSSEEWSLFFSRIAKKVSELIGNAITFLLSLLFILIWLLCGPIFHYSDTWQLIINTSTTIITFLVVFLIQHTQNRDTEIINLKLDELIKGHKGAHNKAIDLDKLSDNELKELEKKYKEICKRTTGV